MNRRGSAPLGACKGPLVINRSPDALLFLHWGESGQPLKLFGVSVWAYRHHFCSQVTAAAHVISGDGTIGPRNLLLYHYGRPLYDPYRGHEPNSYYSAVFGVMFVHLATS